MANEEHLEILKQGVEIWNAWRKENFEAIPDLREANFERADLKMASLGGANLEQSNLKGANLSLATLREASLAGANLYFANLAGADLDGSNLEQANLENARLQNARLETANLEEANLKMVHLIGTDFLLANLRGANLQGALIYETFFSNVDLSATKGLSDCNHVGPCTVDYRTIAKSKDVPLVFWRGCGLPDALIDYMPSLTGHAIEFYSCFISYSSKDREFAARLHADLQDNGVRCWFAPHDMRTGDRIRDTIDEQIRVHEKLLLILSGSSVESNWVENEVEAAMEKEIDRETVLFPLRIDEAIEDSNVAWARTIKRTRHITDFSDWKMHDSYQVALHRLLRDLEVEC